MAERPFLQPTMHLLPISRMIPEMGSSIVNSHISHQLNKTANAWPSPMMMMNFQCHLRRCVHYICAGNHFSVALGKNCLHQDKRSCISFDNDLIGFVSTFPAHLSQHIINAQVPVWESISWNTAFAILCAHHD